MAAENEDLIVEFTLNDNDPIETKFLIEESFIDALFSIDAQSTTWGGILGDINDQKDLIAALDLKADKTVVAEQIETVTDLINLTSETLDNKIDGVQSSLAEDISTLTQTVESYNTATNLRIDETNATVADNFTTLNGKIEINTQAISDLTQTVADNNTAINNRIDGVVTSFDGDISNLENAIQNEATARANADTTLQGNINTLSNTVTSNYTTLDTKIDNTKDDLDSDISVLSDTVNQNYTDLSDAITNTASTINSRINSEVQTLNTAINTENTQRQAADNNLQSQIDAITSASDVFDIVGTYAELQAYDISAVPVNDIIKVLVDSTHNNAATYYRCVENDGVKSWVYIGSEGAYYTKSEADNTFVAKTTTINNKPLSNNITLTASDVNALPADTVIGAGIITLQKNGENIDSFNVNATANKSINITVPTDTANLTNGAGYITIAALNGYATESFVTSRGYITGITSSDVTTALGYTPYNSSNPNGYITASALTNYVTTNTAQDISGRKTFLGEKAIYFKQTATTDKLGFTLYNPSGTELGALEYRPNTISGNALLALNTSQSGSNYVGFRYWSNINIVAPRPSTNGTYFIPTHITNGTTTVTASNNGTVNINTLLPDLSGYATQNWVTSQGYTSNVGTVTSVNNVQPDSNGNVTITIPDTATWGNITGTLSNQTDLQSALNDKYDASNPDGFISGITSSDVTTALGFTPYSASNPNNYTSNVGTVTSVNGTQPDTNGNVEITIPSITIDQTFDPTSENAQSGVAINGAGFLKNIATGTNSLSILGESNAYNYGTAIGDTARAYTNSTALGYNATAGMNTVSIGYKALSAGRGTSIAIGNEAKVNYEGQHSIQIGTGINTTAYSLAIGFNGTNYQLLNGTTGLIPDERLSTNIARISDIPDITDMATQAWVQNQNYLTSSALSGYATQQWVLDKEYTSNIGTVTSVNGIQPDSAGNVTLTIPDSATWGNITGTLSNQTDLQTALNKKLENTATGTGCLTIAGNPSTSSNAMNIGTNSTANGGASIAIGRSANSKNTGSMAIGHSAIASANYAIQLGFGTNSTASTLSVGFNAAQSADRTNWQLLDGITGIIPHERINAVTDSNGGNALKYWTGTKAQYDAITTKDATTLYNIVDDTDVTLALLELLFPVGAVYFGTMATCPLQTLGVGTWQALPSDKVIQIAGTRGSVGDTLNESLPNIKAGTITISDWGGQETQITGAWGQIFKNSTNLNGGSTATEYGINFNASRSSSTYQDNAPVQQDAFLLNGWRRIA